MEPGYENSETGLKTFATDGMAYPCWHGQSLRKRSGLFIKFLSLFLRGNTEVKFQEMPSCLFQTADLLKIELLQVRRRVQRLAFMYEILHGEMALSMAEVDLKLSQRPFRGIDTKRKKLETLRTSTNEFISSFIPRTIADWNSIPESIAASNCSIIQEPAAHPSSPVVCRSLLA